MHRPRNTIAVAKTKQRGRSSAESSGKGLRMGTGRYEWEGGGVSERDGGEWGDWARRMLIWVHTGVQLVGGWKS